MGVAVGAGSRPTQHEHISSSKGQTEKESLGAGKRAWGLMHPLPVLRPGRRMPGYCGQKKRSLRRLGVVRAGRPPVAATLG